MSTTVCVCVCLSVHQHISGATHAIFIKFFVHVAWLDPPPSGWQNPKGKGQFWGFSSPLTMHCNAIMSCSRRDHSVAAAFAANGIGWEGGDGSAQCRQSVIYDCLVSFSDLTLLIRRQEGYPSCSLLLWLFCERLFLCVTWLIRSLTSEKEASWTNKCQL